MRPTLELTVPVLDVDGYLYLPCASEDGSVLRLNRASSEVVRATVEGRTCQDVDDTPAQRLLALLCERGVLAPTRDAAGSNR